MTLQWPVRAHPFCRIILACFALWQLASTTTAKNAHAAVPSLVTRSGSQLMVDGKPFRFAGANIFWLALDSENGRTIYPSNYRIDDAFATVRAMGGTVVRSQAALSTGCAMCIQPRRGEFNETALRRLDMVLHLARVHGLRLVLPLTDNHEYFQGGKHHYTTWRGLSDENAFFTDPVVIGDFKSHISTLLNRVNTYNGVAYKDDPTILAWETGNELSLWQGDRQYNGPPPPAWTTDIAAFIHARARQLVMDGTNIRGKVTKDDGFPHTPYPATIPGIDIYSGHYYYHADWPKSIHMAADLRTDSRAIETAGRVFVAGEYDWTAESNSLGEHKLPEFLATLEDRATGIDGDMFWSLLGHADLHGYAQHNDGFTLQYPGQTPDVRVGAQLLRTHAFRMRGLPTPAHPVPTIPRITSSVNAISWRGVAGADRYTVERSLTGPNGPWLVICAQCKSDWDAPLPDTVSSLDTPLYRVKAHNLDGVAGPYSQVPTGTVIVDDLSTWTKTYSRSANLKLDGANALRFQSDAARAARRTLTAEEIVWKMPGTTSFNAVTYFWNSETPAHFHMFTSVDGQTWKAATPQIAGGQGDWRQFTYTLSNLTNVNYVKMRWNTASTQPWAAQISQVTITGK
jgi:mannan endo-1,4-beta-mannosidase